MIIAGSSSKKDWWSCRYSFWHGWSIKPWNG